MAYDAEKFDLGSSRDHAPTTCAATRDPIARAAPVDPKTLTTPRERLEYLRDFLRGLPGEKFDISNLVAEKSCGTVACIAGWALLLFDGADWEPYDLPEYAYRNLVMPLGWATGSFTPSPQQAADVLDHLIATGKVDWNVARSEA